MTNSDTLLLTALVGFLGVTNPARAQYSCSSRPAATENLSAQLAKFRPVQMPFNTTGLSTREVQMVRKLVEAGQDLESIFWRQSDPQGLAIYQALANCPGTTEKGSTTISSSTPVATTSSRATTPSSPTLSTSPATRCTLPE